VSKKTKKLIKPRKPKKKIIVKTESKKKPIKPIKILKKPAGLVRFYKQKTERTEPNRNRKKPSQTRNTELNQKNRTKTRKNRAKTMPNQKNRAKLVLTGFYPKKPNRIENNHPYLILSSPMSFDGFCRDMVDSIENNWVSCEIIFLPFLFLMK